MEKQRFVWKKEYTAVLIANAVYIMLFYILMKTLS